MIIKTQKTYRCEFCRKLYVNKSFAEVHEPKCKKNPENKHPCFECAHIYKQKVDYFWDSYQGEIQSKTEILMCDKFKKGIFPFWISRPLEAFYIKDEEFGNEQMPFKKCPAFKMAGY